MTEVKENLFKPTELMKLHPVFAKMGTHWILAKIREGKIKAMNIGESGSAPRYLIELKDAEDFIKSLSK